MDKKLAEKLLQDAKLEFENSESAKVYKLIKPLLAENHPEALYLYSRFSLSKLESEEEFEKRSIEMLKASAEAGYLPAIHTLGLCYEWGDQVAMDKVYAAGLFKQAAEAGYSKAKFNHGLNIYYGSYGVLKDTVLGLELIREAALDGSELASEVLLELDPKPQE